MKAWLVEHGYLRSDAQKRRDDLVRQMQDKWVEHPVFTPTEDRTDAPGLEQVHGIQRAHGAVPRMARRAAARVSPRARCLGGRAADGPAGAAA